MAGGGETANPGCSLYAAVNEASVGGSGVCLPCLAASRSPSTSQAW